MSSIRDAEWLVHGTVGKSGTVGSLLPSSFEAFCRLFHSAWNDSGATPVPVRWAEVAASQATIFHPAAEWGPTARAWSLPPHGSMWTRPPTIGSLDEASAAQLAEILVAYTRATSFALAVWRGYGARRAPWTLSRPAFALSLPQREYEVVVGSANELGLSVLEPHHYQSANIWWPEDRSWCVVTEIDLMTSYIGGSRECIDRVVSAPALESLEISAKQAVTWDADTINPSVGTP